MAENPYNLTEVSEFEIIGCHLSSKCSTSMHLFIEAAVQFERCSMKNAVPATICSFCLTDYLYLLRKYNEFVKDSDVKYFGTSCASEVTDQNRLNIIPNHLAAIKNLWNVANCASKLDWENKPLYRFETERSAVIALGAAVFILLFVYDQVFISWITFKRNQFAHSSIVDWHSPLTIQ